MPRRRVTGWDLAVLVAANAAAVVGLWWRQGGIREVHDVAGLLTSLGRVTGLLGALLALVELLLLARIPVLDAVGLERVGSWHRLNGSLCLALIAAHTVLITAGYALTDDVAITREAGDLLTGYSGVLLATIALALLVAVVLSSVVMVRRRLSYRVWHALHVGAYVAIALASAISSPPATSSCTSRSRVRTGGRSTPRPWRRSSASGSSCRWRARCATGCGSSACCPRRPASSRWRSGASACTGCGCSRVSRCTGASSRAATGGRPTRSRCPPRRTDGGCASRSRSSATTPPGSPRCSRVRA